MHRGRNGDFDRALYPWCGRGCEECFQGARYLGLGHAGAHGGTAPIVHLHGCKANACIFGRKHERKREDVARLVW